MSTSRRYLTLFLAPLLAGAAIGIMSPASALAVTNEPVTGTVTAQSTGNPVGGITVTVEATDGTPVTGATATTAADGTYSTPAVAPGTYKVEFNKGQTNTGFLDQWFNDETTLASADPVTVTDGDPTTSQGIDDALGDTGSISGAVSDSSTGANLAGITVEAEDSGGNFVGETTTAADGTYTLANVPAGNDFVAFNPDHSQDYVSQTNAAAVTAGQTTANTNAQLVPASGHVAGTVTNASSAPAPNVTVQAFDTNGNEVGNPASTAANGTYTLTGLSTGTYEVRFQAPESANLAPQYYNGKGGFGSANTISVTSGATAQNINAALQTGAIISGTVTGNGTALGGATVTVLNCGFEDFGCPSTVTAPNGTYTIQGLATGTYYLEFDSPGGQNFVTQYYNSATTEASANPVSAAAGSTTTINQNLPVGGQISGTVTNANAGGIDVEAVDANGQEVNGTATAPNGTYTIMGLATGTYRVRFVSGSGAFVTQYAGGAVSAQTAQTFNVTRGATVGGVNINLTPSSSGGRISGVVHGPGGAPVGGINVTVYDASGNFVARATTDSDGSYKTPALIGGTYKVGFASQGENLAFQYFNGKTSLATANTVSVTGGSTTANVNATLSTGGTVTGRVTDGSSHAALNGVEVDLLDSAGHVLGNAVTLPDGTYTLSGVATGSYHVEFLPNGLAAPGGGVYSIQYYNNKPTLASSDAVSITAGGTTPNINAGLVIGGSPTGVTTKKAGKPTLSKSSLSGIGKRKASLKFKLAAGNNGAPKLKSFKVKLPKGLGFIKKGLKKGLKITGGGKYTDKISKGALIVTLKKTSGSVSVSLSSKALSVSKALGKEAKKHKLKSLKVGVSITDASKKTTSETLTFKKPK